MAGLLPVTYSLTGFPMNPNVTEYSSHHPKYWQRLFGLSYITKHLETVTFEELACNKKINRKSNIHQDIKTCFSPLRVSTCLHIACP